ncbi:VWA domain-containing protein [bacterium]|nr:VWA domain-containing protein [bacterium]
MDAFSSPALRFAAAALATAAATGALARVARKWGQGSWPTLSALLLGPDDPEQGDLRFASVVASVAAGLSWIVALDAPLKTLSPTGRVAAIGVGLPLIALAVAALADIFRQRDAVVEAAPEGVPAPAAEAPSVSKTPTGAQKRPLEESDAHARRFPPAKLEEVRSLIDLALGEVRGRETRLPGAREDLPRRRRVRGRRPRQVQGDRPRLREGPRGPPGDREGGERDRRSLLAAGKRGVRAIRRPAPVRKRSVLTFRSPVIRRFSHRTRAGPRRRSMTPFDSAQGRLSKTARESFLARARAFGDRRWDGVVLGSRGGIGLDAAFLLDTTGSMSVHLNEVRLRTTEIADEIAREVPRSRLGVVCYKDHGDQGENAHYLTLVQPLTERGDDVRAFLNARQVAPGKGGGGAEAVECALRAANSLAWRASARKAIVLVGDKPPHGAGMDALDGCSRGVDYRDEVEALAKKGVRVYTVLVDSYLETRRVFEWMAGETGGKFLELRSSKDLAPLLISVCLAEAGKDVTKFAARLEAEGLLTDSRKQIFLALAG